VLVAVATVVLTLASLSGTQTARATSDYTERLDRPCIACHITSTAPELNDRGRAFAAVDTHRTDPDGAWARAVAEYPLETTRSAVPSWLPLAAVGGAVGAFLLLTSRRRRLTAPPG